MENLSSNHIEKGSEDSNEIIKVVDLAHRMEGEGDSDFIRENLPIFFKMIEKTLGVRLTNNVQKIYGTLVQMNCLLRVERITRILEALEKNIAFQVGNMDSHYANAVIPEKDGVALAFAEGQAPGAVKIMIGLGKTLVGFRANHLKISDVDFIEDNIRDVKKRQYLCRHIEGEIHKEDIVSVVMRIPRHLVKEELLTKEEEETKSPFIFRGFVVE